MTNLVETTMKGKRFYRPSLDSDLSPKIPFLKVKLIYLVFFFQDEFQNEFMCHTTPLASLSTPSMHCSFNIHDISDMAMHTVSNHAPLLLITANFFIILLAT